MTALVGNADARRAFVEAAGRGALHHAWLIAGPQGVGKGLFARQVAARLLAHAADPSLAISDAALPPTNRTAALIAAGSHPDYRELVRKPKDPEKPDENIARSIPIAQVRALQPMFATKPSMSDRRVVVIDAIDDLETGAANALLKNLEEPPAGTLFLLVSHAPGRLLPTIRSRCRVLRFDRLRGEEVLAVLREQAPELDDAERSALADGAEGAPGRALAFAGLDLAKLERAMRAIATTGDPTNGERLRLAKALSGKSAQPRYEAFLTRVPSIIAALARDRRGAALDMALTAYADAGTAAGAALGLSLDPQATVVEMCGILARLAPEGTERRAA